MEVHIQNMSEASCDGAHPTTNGRRIELRDAKMWRRESERKARSGQRRSRCPCSLCLFGEPLLRTTHALHLRDYGRHPLKRLQPEVSSKMPGHSVILMKVGRQIVSVESWICEMPMQSTWSENSTCNILIMSFLRVGAMHVMQWPA